MNRLLTAVVCTALLLPIAGINLISANAMELDEQSKADDYTRFMRIGYAATEQEDYQTALINFRRALEIRPEDPFASKAINNVESYIQRLRAEAIRQQQIQALEQPLNQAIERQDWICAVEIIDRLLALYPSNSLQRASLVTYRGEIESFRDGGADLDKQAGACPNI
ncbi:MAG: hypothetical protein F6K19_07100 [Cyanothece sp. SIO1E1]|nr:hypothetical protein [Cyanothece sp. SIO1E1]